MARRDTILPVSGVSIRFRPPTVRVMVDAGLAVAATLAPEQMEGAAADLAMQRIRTQAQRLICAAAEEPVCRISPPESDRDNVLDVALMDDRDLLHCHALLIDWGQSIFYGTHRRDLDPLTDPGWIEAQQQASAIVDQIARRYGVLPTVVDALSPVEFARVLAYVEAGESAMAKAARTTTKPGRKGRR